MNESKSYLIDNDDNIVWRSCCFDINKSLVKFSVQVIISLIVLILSSYKLVTDDNKEDKSVYISLITLIIGIYTPSPSPNH